MLGVSLDLYLHCTANQNMFGEESSILTAGEFQKLFNELYDPIKNFIYFKTGDTGLSEDLAQDAFIKLWENRGKIKKATVKSYLYTIANNTTINHLKRNQLKYKFKNQLEISNEYANPEFQIMLKEYEQKLNDALAKVPEGSREVFLMNRIEGMKYKEIADNLGLSVKAIEKRISKAIHILHEILGVKL